MGKANWVDFKEIKTQVNIERILERYGLLDTLTRKGDSLAGPCPIHGGSNPTQFHVSLAKNNFNCFGDCHGGGNILDLVAKLEKVDIRQAALLIQEWFLSPAAADEPEKNAPGPSEKQAGDPAQEPQPELVKEEPASTQGGSGSRGKGELVKEKKKGADQVNPPLKFSLKNLDSDHPYLASRGLEKLTVQFFGLGFCSKGRMTGRIAIPIHNPTGELVAYVGRWPGEPPEGEGKYKLPAGFHKSLVIYNFHRAKEFIRGSDRRSGFRHAGKGSGKTRFPAEENSNPPAGGDSQKPWVSEESNRGLILVEGFFDCMRVWQAGFQNVVALLGSAMSEEQEKLIVEAVGPGGTVAIMFDEDAAGWAGQDEVLDRLISQVYVKIIRLGEEGLQPDLLSEEEIRRLLGEK